MNYTLQSKMKNSLIYIICLFYSIQLFADNLTDSNNLFAWAEQNYSQYFSPADAETIELEGYLVRYYSDTDIYLGTLGDDVYVYGNEFGGLLNVGVISDFIDTTNDSNTFAIVDTGQSDCFNIDGGQVSCAGSGQDGLYNGNQPSFTKNNDGTTTDNITGLIWQSSPDTNGDELINTDDKLSQSAAESYCTNLVTAGQGDWRLPDIKTMYSLINFSGQDASSITDDDTSNISPFIDTDYFSFAYGDTNAGERIIDVQYATSTLYVSTTMNGDDTMFGVNLADGRIKGYPITIGGSDKTYTVQCVRGNESYAANSFVDNNDGTISDQATQLMWQQEDSLNTLDWDAAINYCETSNTADYSDWQLPNAKELQSIVDYTRSPDTTNSPAINALFNSTSFISEAGAMDWGYYWSNTTHKNSNNIGDTAVYLSFGRALGYMNGQWLDVHGAGAQRSDLKDTSGQRDNSYQSITDENGNEAIIHGPQGDLVRRENYARCVRSTM